MKAAEVSMLNGKNVHCDLLATNGNKAVTWIHPLPDGRLFTVASAEKASIGNTLRQEQFLFGRISEDGGRNWGPPFYLYTWPETSASMLYAGSMIDSRGQLHVFALRIRKPLDGGIGYVRFDNCFGDHPVYSEMDCLPRYTGSLNNCLETSNGRLIVPFSTITGREDSKFVSSVIYSDDFGLTWSASNDIAVVSDETDIESGAVEPIVLELAENTLVMLIRTVLDVFWYSISYDNGRTWAQAKPTKIKTSNAPGSFTRMPDGRIFVTWNNDLGHPMGAVRYSFARQCLHGAVSDDNLKTLMGARILLKKTPGDPDRVLNCYPYTTMADDGEIFLRFFEVDGKGGSKWGCEQGYLTKVNPDFLTEKETTDQWQEWVCDIPVTEDGVELHATTDDTAYAITSFPYGTSGRLVLKTEGILPEDCLLLLSDCYLDRLNFMGGSRSNDYDERIRTLYHKLSPTDTGLWEVVFSDGTITLSVNGRTVQSVPMTASCGLNHAGILFHGSGSLRITRFEARIEENRWDTGIEYL